MRRKYQITSQLKATESADTGGMRLKAIPAKGFSLNMNTVDISP